VTGWGIMFICGMVLRCADTPKQTRLESGPVTTDLTTTVVQSYSSLRNDVKPVHSLLSSPWYYGLLCIVCVCGLNLIPTIF